MRNTEAKNDFLGSLPILAADESFSFQCHPKVACFNKCCADLNCELGPYDVVRLREALSISSREFIDQYATVRLIPTIGFPEVRLKMTDNARKSCPFVREDGCSVYADRPAPCRYYPLARGLVRGDDGRYYERFAIVKERHCQGFKEKKELTPEAWIRDQGLEIYNTYVTEYHKLIADLKAARRVLNKSEFGIAFLALFRVDDFFAFLSSKNLLEKSKLPKSELSRILSDESSGLAFSMGWLRNFLL